MVELSETGAMLRRATKHSLVALDELGRGTATADGAAIAHAVATRLVGARCRTLFSTHYHRLADDHARAIQTSLWRTWRAEWSLRASTEASRRTGERR